MGMSLSTASVVGIAIGGSVALVASLAGSSYVVLRWKYGNWRDPLGGEDIETSNAVPSVVVHGPQEVTNETRASQSSHTDFLGLSDELTHPVHRDSGVPIMEPDNLREVVETVKRMPSQPSRGRMFYQNFAMRNLRPAPMSAILESPNGGSTCSQAESEGVCSPGKKGNGSPQHTSHSRSTRKSRSRKLKKSNSSPQTDNRKTDAEDLVPKPLFGETRIPSFRASVLVNGDMGILHERSSSVPSFLSSVPEDPFSSQTTFQSKDTAQHHRSTSLLNQTLNPAPSEDPPPLPVQANQKIKATSDCQGRPSCSSTASAGTHDSSIIQADPGLSHLTAGEAFSRRNQEMELIPRIRPLEPDHIRNEWILGSRSSSRQSAREELHKQTSKASLQDRKRAPASASDRLQLGTVSEMQANRSMQEPGGEESKRGSKLGEHMDEDSVLASRPARLCNKNITDKQPSRNQSRTSTRSSSSLERSHHSIRSESVKARTPKSSSLKGSPVSRKRRHKRSDTVKFRIEPAFSGSSSCINRDHQENGVPPMPINNEVHADLQNAGAVVAVETLSPYNNPYKPHSSPSSASASNYSKPVTPSSTILREDPSWPNLPPWGSPSRSTRVSPSASILLKNFPDTPRDMIGSAPVDDLCQREDSLYSEPDFIPPGLELAKLSRQHKTSGIISSMNLNSSPPRPSQELTNEFDGSLNKENEPHDLPYDQHTSSPTTPVGLRILSPTPKSSSTTSVTIDRPASPKAGIRMAPLSSSVNPLNTKPYLPPPYSSANAILRRPSQSSSSSRTLSIKNPTILEQMRALRKSQMAPDAFEVSNTLGGAREETTTTGPTDEEMRWMLLRGSPALSQTHSKRGSNGPLFSLTKESEIAWFRQNDDQVHGLGLLKDPEEIATRATMKQAVAAGSPGSLYDKAGFLMEQRN